MSVRARSWSEWQIDPKPLWPQSDDTGVIKTQIQRPSAPKHSPVHDWGIRGGKRAHRPPPNCQRHAQQTDRGSDTAAHKTPAPLAILASTHAHPSRTIARPIHSGTTGKTKSTRRNIFIVNYSFSSRYRSETYFCFFVVKLQRSW